MRFISRLFLSAPVFLSISAGAQTADSLSTGLREYPVPVSRTSLFADLSPYDVLGISSPPEAGVDTVPFGSLLDFDNTSIRESRSITFTQIPLLRGGVEIMAVFHDGSCDADPEDAFPIRQYYVKTVKGERIQSYVVTMITEKEFGEEMPDFDFLTMPNYTGVVFFSHPDGRVYWTRTYYNGRLLNATLLNRDEQPAPDDHVVFVDLLNKASDGSMTPAARVRVSDAMDWDYLADRERIKSILANGKRVKSVIGGKEVTIVVPEEKPTPPVGEKFRDLRLPDPKGKYHRISDYAGKGRWVLVDFWASWCVPCKQEMPFVTAAYKKYHEKGFEIIGLSFDADLHGWKAAIEAWDMPWIHLSDLQYWQSKAAKIYDIHAIPDNILIDPSGTIVARGLRGPQLEAYLSNVFK